MASRDLALAHPDLQEAFSVLSVRFTQWFPGWKLIVTATYRSPAEQAVEFRAGRSRLDGTRKRSKHNYSPSDAIDVMIVAPGNQLIDTLLVNKKVSKEHFRAMYGIVGMWVQERNLRWGGDWNSNKIPIYADPAESLDDPYHWERRG